MAWQTPKTDWVGYRSGEEYIGDKFNAADYQRIKGNLIYLRELAGSMYPAFAFPDIPDLTIGAGIQASTINALERSLDALASNSFDPGIQARKTWYGNAAGPLAEDLNRIESSCLQLYKTLTGQAECLPRLAITLGGVQF